jgi:hypothetical protein
MQIVQSVDCKVCKKIMLTLKQVQGDEAGNADADMRQHDTLS